jgi:hypothetical protein
LTGSYEEEERLIDALLVGGGNARHTRNMRYAHDTATETLTGPYTEAEF